MEIGIDDLIEMVSLLAEKTHGHLTIMKFTTHWKAMLDTPNLDDGSGRNEIRGLTAYNSLEDALWGIIKEELKRYDFKSAWAHND